MRVTILHVESMHPPSSIPSVFQVGHPACPLEGMHRALSSDQCGGSLFGQLRNVKAVLELHIVEGAFQQDLFDYHSRQVKAGS